MERRKGRQVGGARHCRPALAPWPSLTCGRAIASTLADHYPSSSSAVGLGVITPYLPSPGSPLGCLPKTPKLPFPRYIKYPYIIHQQVDKIPTHLQVRILVCSICIRTTDEYSSSRYIIPICLKSRLQAASLPPSVSPSLHNPPVRLFTYSPTVQPSTLPIQYGQSLGPVIVCSVSVLDFARPNRVAQAVTNYYTKYFLSQEPISLRIPAL